MISSISFYVFSYPPGPIPMSCPHPDIPKKIRPPTSRHSLICSRPCSVISTWNLSHGQVHKNADEGIGGRDVQLLDVVYVLIKLHVPGPVQLSYPSQKIGTGSIYESPSFNPFARTFNFSFRILFVRLGCVDAMYPLHVSFQKILANKGCRLEGTQVT